MIENDTNSIQAFLACKITSGPIPSPASAAILSSYIDFSLGLCLI
jgi:hypothetical protein